LIPPSSYHSAEVFVTEMARLFRDQFQFVGLTSELASDRDFVSVEHAGASIVVQNFKGSLRAFENVCSHRFSKIQTEDRGNRPLTCRYHGWSFNEAGQPFAMPKRAEYLEDGADLELLCLKRYRVETCGKFVFVIESENPLGLQEYLGEFYPVVEQLSGHLGAEFHYDVIPHAANWKILVENVLDNHHCALLHRDSFIAWGFCKLPLEDVRLEGRHSSFHVPRAEGDREALRRRAFSHLEDRSFAHDSFYHIMVFPNLFIASNEGMSFYVGHALPIAPGETLLRVRYFEPAMAFEKGRRMRQDIANEQTKANAVQVIYEDKPILESIQKGAQLTNQRGIVARGEVRIRAFLDRYAELMA
jgi:phenylpropionate dioxygenase-like ring-hydroxylating dioxygenase large terminal subunit